MHQKLYSLFLKKTGNSAEKIQIGKRCELKKGRIENRAEEITGREPALRSEKVETGTERKIKNKFRKKAEKAESSKASAGKEKSRIEI
jgi:hypothetical protein